MFACSRCGAVTVDVVRLAAPHEHQVYCQDCWRRLGGEAPSWVFRLRAGLTVLFAIMIVSVLVHAAVDRYHDHVLQTYTDQHLIEVAGEVYRGLDKPAEARARLQAPKVRRGGGEVRVFGTWGPGFDDIVIIHMDVDRKVTAVDWRP